MSDLIGTAVRALGESLGVGPAEVGDDIVVRCRVAKLAPAAEAVIRATLAALREPSAAMRKVGYDVDGSDDIRDGVWFGMLDAFEREHGLEAPQEPREGGAGRDPGPGSGDATSETPTPVPAAPRPASGEIAEPTTEDRS